MNKLSNNVTIFQYVESLVQRMFIGGGGGFTISFWVNRRVT